MSKKMIFISHSSKNADKANELCSYLESNHKTCFIAPRDIRKGFEYAEEIINGIDSSFVMVLMLSDEANHSPHVLREIERAVSRNIPIIIYKMEEVELTKSLEYFLMTHQWIDNDSGFDVILEAVINREKVIRAAAGNAGKATAQEESADALQACQTGNLSDTNRAADSSNTASVTGVTNTVRVGFSGKKKLAVIISAVAVVGVIVLVGIYSGGNSGLSDAADGADRTQMNNEVMSQTAVQERTSTGEAQSEDTQPEDKTDAVDDWNVGGEVTFGRYNDEAIDWRVLKENEDGTYMLVSSKILSVKAFDAAESGEAYMYEGESYIGLNKPDVSIEAYVTGDNSWDTSNIRTWLNSSDEVVNYTDTPPGAKGMADGKNGYNVESGFLHGFTDEELEHIVEVENITKGNVLRADGDITTKDKVYLLAESELSLFDDAGISRYAKLTDIADSLDQAQWKNLYKDLMNTEYGIYWLRDCVDGSATKVKVMANGNIDIDVIEVYSACCDGIGIRPVINVRR